MNTAPKNLSAAGTKEKLNDEQQINQHIQQLEPAVAEVVNHIRKVILAVDPEIGERIKWNNPSFYYTGAIKDFDPKEYKREIAVFNLFKGRIMLVFPSGAKLNDTSGFLEGNYADGRRTAVFKDLQDAISKEKILSELLRTWLSLVDKPE